MTESTDPQTSQDEPIVRAVEQTHVVYDFHLSERDFAQLVGAEGAYKIPFTSWVSLSLEGSEEAGVKGVPGVCSVDYEYRYGPTISCMIESDYDNKITHEAISEVIADRMKWARRLAGTET